MRRRVADRCEGAVTMPVERHVAVDLVRDDHDAAAVADRGQPAQRLLRPDDARGIVWVGEEQQPAVVVQKGFELLEVHFVAVARAPQRVADHAASHLFGDQPEGVVDGGWMTTLSPGRVSASTAMPMPLTMPGMKRIHAGSGRQPWRASIHAAICGQ